VAGHSLRTSALYAGGGKLFGAYEGAVSLQGVAAVVLRVDSPGGDALASDLMWRQIQRTAKLKPVIASMGDVAASGGESSLQSAGWS
jgi:protease IV